MLPKMFLAKVLSLMCFVKMLLEACNEGCLKCFSNPDSQQLECQICDSMRGFILKGTECQNQTLDNCLVSFTSGSCSICSYGYYLTADFKCASVPSKSKISIQSCNNYVTINKCLVCDFYTYERNGLCRPTQARIDDCTKYFSPTQCEICNLKLPSFDKSACEKVTNPKFNNCLFFRHPLVCKKCKPGFDINENYFLKNIAQNQMYQNFFLNLKFWRESYFSLMMNTPVCSFKYTIDNCQVLDYNYTCAVCSPGYTLSPDKTLCFMRPTPPVDPRQRIPNCYKFATQNYETCQICYENYYLQDLNTRCKRHTNLVPNCAVHSQTSDSQCIYCDNPFYLNVSETDSSKACVSRVNFFNNCQAYHRTIDICLGCMSGHLFHFNNTRCSPLITNCVKHDTSSRILKCSNCVDTHYLNDYNTMCIDAHASTEGCKKYNYNAVCIECDQTYYLDSVTKKCLVQDQYINCQILSVFTKGECTVCQNQGTRTLKIDTCVNVGLINIITDCLAYNKNQVCIQCKANKVPFQGADGKVICTSFEGCTQLLSITDSTKCAACASPYILWKNLCVKADQNLCRNSFQNNSTYSLYTFVDEIPCEVCDSGTYYVANPGTRDSRCIPLTFGKNCLNFYSTTVDLPTNSYCNQCRRGYMLNTTNTKECYLNDVYAPYSSATIDAKNFRTLSFDTLVSYNSASLNVSSMFPSKTFSAASTYSASTLCYQTNSANNLCLSCKVSYCNVYNAISLSAMFNASNQFPHTSYIYTTNVSKVAYESTFSDSSYPVYSCEYCGNSNTTSYPKEAHIFNISNVIHYHCKWAHDLSQWTKDDTAMTLATTITASTFPIGYVVGTAASYTSSCIYNFGASTPRITNCVSNFNDTDLALTFEQRVFFSSCQNCTAGYVLSYANYTASVTYNGAVAKKFQWILNECTDKSLLASYYYMSNCFYYEKTFQNEQQNFECKACNPGSFATTRLKPYVCPPTDPNYSLEKEDHCKSPLVCDKHLYCRTLCPNGCPAGQYCTPLGACVDIICKFCTLNPSDANCIGTIDGCPSHQYCQEGTCYNKCTCLHTEKCDASTNYTCVPLMCGNYTGISLTALIADIPNQKAAAVQKLVEAQEALWLQNAKDEASASATSANAYATTAEGSAASASTSSQTATDVQASINNNVYANASEKTDADNNAAAASTASALALQYSVAARAAATAAANFQTLTLASATSAEAQPYADQATIEMNYANANATLASSQLTITQTKTAANQAILSNLLSKENAATQDMNTAIADATTAMNQLTAIQQAQTDANLALDALLSNDYNAKLIIADACWSTATAAVASALAASNSAAQRLPGSDVATNAATYYGYANANLTEITAIRSSMYNRRSLVDLTQFATQAKNAYTASSVQHTSAKADYDSFNSASMDSYITSITTQEQTALGIVTSAISAYNLAMTTFDAASTHYTMAMDQYSYITGNKTAISDQKKDVNAMKIVLSLYSTRQSLQTISENISTQYTTAETFYTNKDNVNLNAILSTSAYTAVSGVPQQITSVNSQKATIDSTYPSYTSVADVYASEAIAFGSTATSYKSKINHMNNALTAYGYTTTIPSLKDSIDQLYTHAVGVDNKADLLTDQTAGANYYQQIASYFTQVTTWKTSAETDFPSESFTTDLTNYYTTISTQNTAASAKNDDLQALEWKGNKVQRLLRATRRPKSADFIREDPLKVTNRFKAYAKAQRSDQTQTAHRLLFTRAEFVAQVELWYWGPGCNPNEFCFEQTCIPNTGCPICEKNQYCTRTAANGGGFQYSCQNHTYCNTNCKPQNKYCHATFSNNVYTPSSCQTYPQRALDTTAVCSPACAADEVCVDGVCNKSFATACSFALLNAVPVYCGSDEDCVNGVCIKHCQPKCEIGFTCDSTNNKCIEDPFLPQKTIIDKCTAVVNCSTNQNSRRLNSCDKCFETGAFLLTVNPDGTTSVDTATCIDLQFTNCKYAYKRPSDGQYACYQCDPGYTLIDGGCTYTVKSCKEYDSSGKCRWCTDGYGNEALYLMNALFETGNCKTYPAPAPVGVNYSDNPDTDQNCLFFQFYYLQPKQPAALSGGKNICFMCQDNFFLTKTRKCLYKSITNCTTYDDTVNAQASVVCTKCDLGFTLAANKVSCIDNTPTDTKYLIPKCKSYSVNFNCVQCDTGFMLKTVGTNAFAQNTYCFSSVPSDPNCDLLDASTFENNKTIACLSCKKIQGSFAYPAVLDNPIKMCLSLASKSKCVAQNSGTFSSDYSCTACESPDYYLDLSTNKCLIRTITVDNCEQYSLTNQTCIAFKVGSVTTNDVVDVMPIDVQKLIATPPIKLEIEVIVDFKGWIMGCRTYADSNTCAACDAPKYLNKFGFDYNTKCKIVDRAISHCAHYDSDGLTCLRCDDFYLLIDNTCQLRTVENCARFDGPNKCVECTANFPYLDEDGNCSIDRNNPWCLIYDLSSNPSSYDCDTCMEGYYLNDSGICTSVLNIIAGCKYYWNDRTCKVCQHGYYLRYDGKTCDVNPSFDENCVEFDYGTECSICQFGYFLKDGLCTSCSEIDSGCAYCDPLSPSQCLMCKFGYNMGGNSTCVWGSHLPVNDSFVIMYDFNITDSDDSNITASYDNLQSCIAIIGDLLRTLIAILLWLAF